MLVMRLQPSKRHLPASASVISSATCHPDPGRANATSRVIAGAHWTAWGALEMVGGPFRGQRDGRSWRCFGRRCRTMPTRRSSSAVERMEGAEKLRRALPSLRGVHQPMTAHASHSTPSLYFDSIVCLGLLHLVHLLPQTLGAATAICTIRIIHHLFSPPNSASYIRRGR